MDTARIDLVINQGEDWTVQMWFMDENNTPMPLVNPFRMDMVNRQTGGIAYSLLSSDLPPDFQEGVPEIIPSRESGLVQLHLTSERTDSMTPGVYDYDLFGHVDDGDAFVGDQAARLCAGQVYVNKRITQTF